MHAYLIVGESTKNREQSKAELIKRLKVKTLEFSLAKIEDTRTLNSFTSLVVASPTAIIINSIEEATVEALNAFLKNLEEPQADLYYILTTESIHQVLPTIVSRCQVIKVKSEETRVKSREMAKFLNTTVGEKLAFIDKIRDRQGAKSFVRDLISYLHQTLHDKSEGFRQTADNLEFAQRALNNLKANANVGLQLTNLVINLH